MGGGGGEGWRFGERTLGLFESLFSLLLGIKQHVGLITLYAQTLFLMKGKVNLCNNEFDKLIA